MKSHMSNIFNQVLNLAAKVVSVVYERIDREQFYSKQEQKIIQKHTNSLHLRGILEMAGMFTGSACPACNHDAYNAVSSAELAIESDIATLHGQSTTNKQFSRRHVIRSQYVPAPIHVDACPNCGCCGMCHGVRRIFPGLECKNLGQTTEQEFAVSLAGNSELDSLFSMDGSDEESCNCPMCEPLTFPDEK